MKQNKNFNFQSMSSANEKMLIIFSWIIVVIIVVLVGLYYGQQVREQEIGAARIQSADVSSKVEVAADSDSKIEEGELTVSQSAESVLTDSMTLNKNEVFCVQIAPPDGADAYNAEKADAVIAEFVSKGLYSKKIVSDVIKNLYVVQIGVFKNYEDAKTFLNTVKLKNYPAQIMIVPDPNVKPENAPAPAAAVTSQTSGSSPSSVKHTSPDVNSNLRQAEKAEPVKNVSKDVVVSTSDSEVIDSIKTSSSAIKPSAPAETSTVSDSAASGSSSIRPPGAHSEHDSPASAILKKPEDEPSAAESAESEIEDKIKEVIKPIADKKEVKKIEVEKKDVKKETSAKSGKKTPLKEPAVPANDDDEIMASDDDFEIVADGEGEEDVSESVKSVKGPYYVQIGTYKNNKNASGLKAKLKKMGLSNVVIVPGNLASGDTVYRVRMTGYSSKDSAEKAFSGVKSSFPDVKPYIAK